MSNNLIRTVDLVISIPAGQISRLGALDTAIWYLLYAARFRLALFTIKDGRDHGAAI
jgi:hypothetical protein